MEDLEDPSLFNYLDSQLDRLCGIVGIDSESASVLLADLLGPAGRRPLSLPPAWPSGVADDHTPVEFSIAFNANERPTLRILGETLDSVPSASANMAAARRFVEAQAARFGLSMSQFDRVSDLFATNHPLGGFGLWYSLVFRPGRRRGLQGLLQSGTQGSRAGPEPGGRGAGPARAGPVVSGDAATQHPARRTGSGRPADVLRAGSARRAARPRQALSEPPRRRGARRGARGQGGPKHRRRGSSPSSASRPAAARTPSPGGRWWAATPSSGTRTDRPGTASTCRSAATSATTRRPVTEWRRCWTGTDSTAASSIGSSPRWRVGRFATGSA